MKTRIRTFLLMGAVPFLAAPANANLAKNSSSKVTTGRTPSDNDGDGMADWWKGLCGLVVSLPSGINNPNGAAHDFGGGGVSNFDERLADAGPRDPNSFFHISAVGHEGNVTVLEFQSSCIRRYNAPFTPDIHMALTNFLSFDGTGGVISILRTNGSGGFYRLQAELP